MSRFSQRIGLSPASKLAQVDSMDDELKVQLWNVVERVALLPGLHHPLEGDRLYMLIDRLWSGHFKRPLSNKPDDLARAVFALRVDYDEANWWQRLDLLEAIARLWRYDDLAAHFNAVFQSENGGWRFINGQLTPISGESDVQAVATALADTSGLSGARTHLEQALQLLSSRESPDFRNSIKESISAVESVVKAVTQKPKATLGEALDLVPNLHGALRNSLNSLYGYTSNADGIRHGMMDTTDLTVIDARFALVTCSAFCSYLVAKAKPNA